MTNEINFTPEMLEQAKSAPSAAALLILAQENGITMTAKKAATYYARFHPETGAISDEELDNVSAGCGSSPPEKCKFCPCTEFRRTRAVKGRPSRWACKSCGKLA